MEQKTEPMEIFSYGHTYKVRPNLTSYMFGGGLCIELICADAEDYGEPFGNLTVNLAGKQCDPDEAYVDTNNIPTAGGFIRRYNLGHTTGETAQSGFCFYPKYKFNIEELKKYAV